MALESHSLELAMTTPLETKLVKALRELLAKWRKQLSSETYAHGSAIRQCAEDLDAATADYDALPAPGAGEAVAWIHKDDLRDVKNGTPRPVYGNEPKADPGIFFALCVASPLPASEPDKSARDWPEDFSHENGNYSCKCAHCGNVFLGHKRRVVCKACAQPTADRVQDAPEQSAPAERVTADDIDVLRTLRADIMDSTSLSYGGLLRERIVDTLARVIALSSQSGERG